MKKKKTRTVRIADLNKRRAWQYQIYIPNFHFDIVDDYGIADEYGVAALEFPAIAEMSVRRLNGKEVWHIRRFRANLNIPIDTKAQLEIAIVLGDIVGCFWDNASLIDIDLVDIKRYIGLFWLKPRTGWKQWTFEEDDEVEVIEEE